jgi:hypothetical protein
MANPSVFFPDSPDPPGRHSPIEHLTSAAAALQKGAHRLTSAADALSLFPEEASLGAAAAAESLVQPTPVTVGPLSVVDAEKVVLEGLSDEVARIGQTVSALEARIAKMTEKDQPLAVGEVRARELEQRGAEITAQLERADGIVGRLEHRLAEMTAELNRARKAQDDLGREVARLHQQLETLRDSARKQVQVAARGPSSPSKPWVTMGIVAGVTAVALTGIIATRPPFIAPQERNGGAERSAVAASLPALPATPLGFAISGMQTLPAASRTPKNAFTERRMASNGNKQAPAPVPKQVTRPAAERSSNASVVKAPRPTPEFVGALEVQSDPVGSAVFVDRKYIGETPVQLTELRAGSHIVWIQRDGYQRWTASVLVPAEKRTRVTATLQPDRNHH